jgi:endoglucanase
MNEPHDQTGAQWAAAAQAAVTAIRNVNGATQTIYVPATNWSGAWHWDTNGNAPALLTVNDPANNMVFEAHQYLDSDGSGQHYTPITDPNIGVSRITGVTAWARANGKKLFLGEFGVASDSQSLTALNNMLSYMQQNSDVWIGGTYWAGGPWWDANSFGFDIEPSGSAGAYVDRPQMGVLRSYAPQ